MNTSEYGPPPKVQQPEARNATEKAIDYVIAQFHVAGWRQMVADVETQAEVA